LASRLVFALLAAAVSGAAMSFQGAFNASLQRRVGLVGASLVVHIVGLVVSGIVLGLTLALGHRIPVGPGLLRAPWFAYLGGILSVLIIMGVAFAFPVAGAGLGVSTIVTAQLIAALVLDHFGWCETRTIPVTWVRLLGAALLILGTRLVAR